MGSPIKAFVFFLTSYFKETMVVILLLVLAGLAEAFGVAAFLPFLQIVLEGNATLDYIPEGGVKEIIENSGISINFTTVGLFIVVAISTKAVILWIALHKVGTTVAYISSDLRARLMKALLHANWRFYASHTLGTSLNAIVMESYRSSVAFLFSSRFIAAAIQFLVYAISACLLSWKIFIGSVLAGGIVIIALWSLVKKAHSAGSKQTDIAKKMLVRMADMLQGIKPLRAMALEGKYMDVLKGQSKILEKAQADELTSTQTMKVFYEPIMVLTAVSGLFVAMKYGELQGSGLALMAIIFVRLLGSMNNVQSEYQKLSVQQSALWSLLDTIEKTEGAFDQWSGTSAPPEQIKSIELKSIDFAYDDKKVISNGNIKFQPQKMTALIGESGSGKTSILDLVSGFYTPDKGQIFINDINLNDLDLKLWRKNIGFVPQEVFLFNGSISENIKVGREDITDEAMWLALEKSGARHFVEALPEKLDAPVGEGGRMLSGGQRQRIAIARAIVHDPQILFLDEATSALDHDTEQNLLHTLQKLSRSVTIIFVSHNKIVQEYADNVYKISEGKIKKQQRKQA